VREETWLRSGETLFRGLLGQQAFGEVEPFMHFRQFTPDLIEFDAKVRYLRQASLAKLARAKLRLLESNPPILVEAADGQGQDRNAEGQDWYQEREGMAIHVRLQKEARY
jgi:hypothetical protein